MSDKEEKRQLYEHVKALVEEEKALRQEFTVGAQYCAIPSRLNALLSCVKQATISAEEHTILQRVEPILTDSQQYVYVYLYNAKGKILSRWEAMLSPRNLFEYSVNRPVYQAKNQVETYIRSRTNRDEHAFLMIKIEKTDILGPSDENLRQDSLGQPLLKLKEGALREEELIYFFHHDRCYIFLQGHLVPQE